VSVLTFDYNQARWSERMAGVPVEVVQKRNWADVFFGVTRSAKLQRRTQRAGWAMKGFGTIVAHNSPCSAMLACAQTSGRKLWYCHEPPRDLYMRLANPYLAAHMADSLSTDFASLKFARDLKEYDQRIESPTSLQVRYDFDQKHIPNLDAIAVNSEYSRNTVRAIYGRAPERVIYPILRYSATGVRRQGMNRSGLGILVHSRLELLKNIDTVIRGFALFLKDHSDAHLHVVGEGTARTMLEKFAWSILPLGSVSFHGYLPDADLRKIYEVCDVLAMLPLDEPFGMVFPEAAAMGLLLVGPDHGGPMEIMDGGRLGWPVNAFSPEALSEALNRVCSLSDTETDCRREAADRACRNRYAAEIIGPKILDFVRMGC